MAWLPRLVIRALHIDQGFLDRLVDCLRLQRVLRGIKRCQGYPPSTRLLITDELMLVIWQSFDLGLPDHQMLRAACSLGYFGFLRVSEFTVSNLSTLQWILHRPHRPCAYESRAPRRTRPGKAVLSTLALAGILCAVHAMMTCLPLSLLANGQPLTRTILTGSLRQIMISAQIPGNFSPHSFRIGAATVAARNGIPDHWAVSPATLFSFILGHRLTR